MTSVGRYILDVATRQAASSPYTSTQRDVWADAAVRLAEIVDMRSGAEPGDVEGTCHRCLGPNPIWHAPSPLWNRVMRGNDIGGVEPFDGIICPMCFAELADKQGVAKRWRFSAEQVNVPLVTALADGRVWDEETQLWREAAPGETPGQVQPDDAKPQPINIVVECDPMANSIHVVWDIHLEGQPEPEALGLLGAWVMDRLVDAADEYMGLVDPAVSTDATVPSLTVEFTLVDKGNGLHELIEATRDLLDGVHNDARNYFKD